MNIYYAKAALYAYPHIDKIAEEIDNTCLKKALRSASDISSAQSQCEEIVFLKFKKQMLLEFKSRIEKALSGFKQSDLDKFEYKYFRRKGTKYFEDFDSSSCTYFRRQKRIAQTFAIRLSEAGVDDGWFEGEGAKFIKPYIKDAIEHDENQARKRKAK